MSVSNDFVSWACDPKRTNDELSTVEWLIEGERLAQDWPFKKQESFDARWARMKERKLNPAYRPSLRREEIEAMVDFAPKVQRFSHSSSDQPLRSLAALAFFPALTDITAGHSDIADFSPLAALPHLKRFSLFEAGLVAEKVLDRLETWGEMRELEYLYLAVRNAWPDLRAIAHWAALREFHFSGNVLSLAEVESLPAAECVQITNWLHLSVPLRDLKTFTRMPKVRRMTLGPVANLEGIERYPTLLNLDLTGPFRDLTPLIALASVTSLVLTGEGFRDLTPLARMPALRQLKIVRERPIDLSPLTEAPGLREMKVERCNILRTELAALNAGLIPWSADFALGAPRVLQPLRYVWIEKETDESAKWEAEIRNAETEPRAEYFGGDLALSEAEGKWFARELQQKLDQLLGRGWGLLHGTYGHVHIKRYQDVMRLREIIQTLREASAGCKFPKSFLLCVEPHGDMSDDLEDIQRCDREEEESKGHWLEEYVTDEAQLEEAAEFRQQKREEYEFFEREHQMRLREQEGAQIEVEQFAPLPLEPEKDDDESEPNEIDSLGEEGEGGVAIAPPPPPPPEGAESLGDELEFFVNLHENMMIVNDYWKGPATYCYDEEPERWTDAVKNDGIYPAASLLQ